MRAAQEESYLRALIAFSSASLRPPPELVALVGHARRRCVRLEVQRDVHGFDDEDVEVVLPVVDDVVEGCAPGSTVSVSRYSDGRARLVVIVGPRAALDRVTLDRTGLTTTPSLTAEDGVLEIRWSPSARGGSGRRRLPTR